MADPTVSKQMTDAVTQANVKVLGDSPALSLSNLYQTISQSLSLSAQNAVMSQQQSNIIHQATTTQGVNNIYSVNNAILAGTVRGMMQGYNARSLSKIIAIVKALKNS